MFTIIRWSFESTSSNVHASRCEFCDISRPDVATPPALAALPGPKDTFASKNTFTASGVDGIFAPSATAIQPFLTSVWALLPSSSFCVAQGSAISQGTVQISNPPSVYFALLTSLAYSLIRFLSISFSLLITSSLMPSAS